MYLFLRPLQPLQYYWGLNVGTIAFRLFWVLVGWGDRGDRRPDVPPASPSVLLMTLVSVLFAELVYGFSSCSFNCSRFGRSTSWRSPPCTSSSCSCFRGRSSRSGSFPAGPVDPVVVPLRGRREYAGFDLRRQDRARARRVRHRGSGGLGARNVRGRAWLMETR